MARPLDPVWRPPLNTRSLGNIPSQPIEGNGLTGGNLNRVRSAAILMRFARGPSRYQLAEPGTPRCPNGPAAGFGAVADGNCQAGRRLPRGGRSDRPPSVAAFEWRRTAPSASASTAHRAGVSAVRSAGQQNPSSRGSALGQRSVPGLLPNTRLHRTGAQGSGLTSRGRAPILVEAGAAAWCRVAPAVEPQSLGNIPPQPIEGNGLAGGDPDGGRSAVTHESVARVPSRHQLAGPGSRRCPNGPAAGSGAVADGSCRAGHRLPRDGRSDRPRPPQRSSGAGPLRQHPLQRPSEPGFRLGARPASLILRRRFPRPSDAPHPGCCLTRACTGQAPRAPV